MKTIEIELKDDGTPGLITVPPGVQIRFVQMIEGEEWSASITPNTRGKRDVHFDDATGLLSRRAS